MFISFLVAGADERERACAAHYTIARETREREKVRSPLDGLAAAQSAPLGHLRRLPTGIAWCASDGRALWCLLANAENASASTDLAPFAPGHRLTSNR